MRRRFKSYFRTQIVLSVVTVGLFSFLFFTTGIFQSEESFVQQEMKPVQHRKPLPPKKVAIKEIGQLQQTATVLDHALQTKLSHIAVQQMVSPEAIQLSQKTYGWLKGLMKEDQQSVLHLLQRMPVERWEHHLKNLQDLPKQAFRMQLRGYKPASQDICDTPPCDV